MHGTNFHDPIFMISWFLFLKIRRCPVSYSYKYLVVINDDVTTNNRCPHKKVQALSMVRSPSVVYCISVIIDRLVNTYMHDEFMVWSTSWHVDCWPQVGHQVVMQLVYLVTQLYNKDAHLNDQWRYNSYFHRSSLKEKHRCEMQITASKLNTYSNNFWYV